MPMALIPAIIGAVAALASGGISAVAAMKKKGGPNMSPEGKKVGESQAADFSRLDAFGSTLDPLNIAPRPGQQPGFEGGPGVGGNTVNFNPPVSLSPSSTLGDYSKQQQQMQNPFGAMR